MKLRHAGLFSVTSRVITFIPQLCSGHNMLLGYSSCIWACKYWTHWTNHHSTVPCFCCASENLIRTSNSCCCCFQCFVKSFFSGFIGFLHVVSHSYIMYLILSVFSLLFFSLFTVPPPLCSVFPATPPTEHHKDNKKNECCSIPRTSGLKVNYAVTQPRR